MDTGVFLKRNVIVNETDAAAEPAARSPAAPTRGTVLRTNRQKRQRADMVDAGLALFMEHGYEQTTVVEIAERVGVSRRTFFRHFESKEDIVFDWMGRLGEWVRTVLAASQPNESPAHAMARTFGALAGHLVERDPQARALTRLIYSNATLTGRYHEEHAQRESEFVAILTRGRSPSAMEAFHLRVQVSAAISAFVVAIRTWAEQANDRPLQFWVDEAFQALADRPGPAAASTRRPPGPPGEFGKA